MFPHFSLPILCPFLTLRVPMCLSPFLHLLMTCHVLSILFSQKCPLHLLSGYPVPISLSLSLSLFLCVCVCVPLSSFCSVSASLFQSPPLASTSCASFSAGLSLPGHKTPAFQPYVSGYHGLSRVSWSLPGSLALHYVFSHSFSLTMSDTFRPGLLLRLCVSANGGPFLFPSALLPSQCLLAPIIVSPNDSAHLSLSLSVSPLSPTLFFLGAQPTYRNRSWPAVSQICSFTVFPPTLTTRDPNSTPIVWLESCLNLFSMN